MIEQLKSMSVVAWGGYQYFQNNEVALKQKVNITAIYAKKEYIKDCNKDSVIEEKEDILKIPKVYVIICLARYEEVKQAADWCKENGVPFTHLSFIIEKAYDSRYVQAIGGRYIDFNNNLVVVDSKATGNIFIEVGRSHNAFVKIGKIKVTEKLYVAMLGYNGELRIGDNTTAVVLNISINSRGKVTIGDDCMFAHNVSFMQSDQHLIFDLNTKKRINYAKDIEIGNHVWIGRECQILGGAKIGDNSVCGARSVTSSKFPSNVIVAGSPAKVIRTGIIWARDLVEQCDYDFYDECRDKSGMKYVK